DPRPPLRYCVPIENPPRAFIGWIGGENQTSSEFSAQPLDSAATEVVSVGYLKTPTARGEPKCPGGGDRSFEKVASRVTAHLYSGPFCIFVLNITCCCLRCVLSRPGSVRRAVFPASSPATRSHCAVRIRSRPANTSLRRHARRRSDDSCQSR